MNDEQNGITVHPKGIVTCPDCHQKADRWTGPGRSEEIYTCENDYCSISGFTVRRKAGHVAQGSTSETCLHPPEQQYQVQSDLLDDTVDPGFYCRLCGIKVSDYGPDAEGEGCIRK